MRKKTISPQAIIEATILLVAQNGLENVSTRKVAEQMGIAEGSIFNYFPTKRNLMVICLNYIDNEIDITLKSVSFQGLNIYEECKSFMVRLF